MIPIKKTLLIIIFFMSITFASDAQKFALKSNLLYDATATINIGTEIALSPKWTLDFSANYNPFQFSKNMKWKHWLVQPEMRYWLCNKWNRSFFAAHLLGGQFNIGGLHFLSENAKFLNIKIGQLNHYRVQGSVIGLGVGYGFSKILSPHWNLEAEIALGYALINYEKFTNCQTCGTAIDKKSRNYLGPTKIALNLVYLL